MNTQIVSTPHGHLLHVDGAKRPYRFTKNERTVAFATLESAVRAQGEYFQTLTETASAISEAKQTWYEELYDSQEQ